MVSGDLNVILGDRLRELRIQHAAGRTVGDIAQAAGLSRATIFNAESGAKCPNAETLVRLAGALGVPPAEFFTPFG